MDTFVNPSVFYYKEIQQHLKQVVLCEQLRIS